MRFSRYITVSAITLFAILPLQAANEPDNDSSPDCISMDRPGFFDRSVFDVEAVAGVNLGGAAPIPLPVEIREIESYNPNLNLSIGLTATKWFSLQQKWGVAVGLQLMTKGMSTMARVKNYGMEIIQDGKSLSGRWTGKVKTRYHSQQLVVPIQAVWSCSRRVRINLGPYLAYAFKNEFDGYVTEGYLREGNPTGEKVTFDKDSRADYDFDSDLRDFHWGWQGGVAWDATRHFSLHANLMWGCNGIFIKSFKTVTFALYPIYLNIGFGYNFK